MWQRKQAFGWSGGAVLALAGLALISQAALQAQEEPRAAYSFDADPQGFTAISFKGAELQPDGDAKLSIAKEQAKAGAGALEYAYKVEPGAFRALAAETRLPKGTQSVRFWAKSSTTTAMLLSVRGGAGKAHQLTFYLPAHEWVPVAANFDELLPEQKREEPKVDVAQVTSVAFSDLATMLVNAGDIARFLPEFTGSRTLWLDELQFSAERVPQTLGPVTADGAASYVVDNFETGTIRWTPVRAVLAEMKFNIFPADMPLKVVTEAAGPGMARSPVEPGGKGLRASYRRAGQELVALVRSLEKEDLSRANRLRLSFNCSKKTLLLIQIKETDDSEYQHIVMPENSVGWQSLNLALTDFALGENSRDENNSLDASQIKEITIVDASLFLGGGDEDVTLDLDAVSFTLQ
jgi:hypothetical protein